MKLLKTVPSTNDEFNLEEVTEECLTSQSTITNAFLKTVDITREELSEEWIEISNCINIPPTPVEVSKVLETPQSYIPDNILPMNPSPAD